MKTYLKITLIVCFLTNTLRAQTIFQINTTTSVINWTGHAEIGSYSPAGTLNFKGGNVTINNKKITAAMLTVDMKSMKQENQHLLEHLKSDDFFDVEKFPDSKITIDNVVSGVAHGQLTIKNRTLSFQCPISVQTKDGFTVVSGKTMVDRTKYGIIYNSGNFFSGLGDKAIRNTFDIEFIIVLTVQKS